MKAKFLLFVCAISFVLMPFSVMAKDGDVMRGKDLEKNKTTQAEKPDEIEPDSMYYEQDGKWVEMGKQDLGFAKGAIKGGDNALADTVNGWPSGTTDNLAQALTGTGPQGLQPTVPDGTGTTPGAVSTQAPHRLGKPTGISPEHWRELEPFVRQ